MAVNDIWEVTLNQGYGGQLIANVFFYRGNAATSPDALDIAQSFYEQILPDIQACTADDLFYDNISVRNILSEDVAVQFPVAETGAGGGGDSLAPHDAYRFKLAVATNVTRPGGKRFAAPSEGGQADGVITNATIIDNLNALGLTLAFNLFDHTAGIIPWAAAVIVKRILEDGVYRLPTSVGELVTNAVTDAIPSLIIGTQTSRRVPPGG